MALAAANGCARAQMAAAPDTTLKVTSRLVDVTAVVRAKNGDAMRGLTKDDFVLKQDGREQVVQYFSAGEDEALSIAVLVDVSGSLRSSLRAEERATAAFFDVMLHRPQDRAMLVQFDERILQLKALTDDVGQLHAALDEVRSDDATNRHTRLIDAIGAVSEDVLNKSTGRKVIVVLTDGEDEGSRRSWTYAVEQAQRANASVYGVHYSDWLGAIRSGPHSDPGVDPGAALLKKFAEGTGGRVFEVGPALSVEKIYAEIEKDLQTQYVMGYVPPAETKPGAVHKLSVTTKAHGARVLARDSFYAP